jgi:hypothetical protein
LNGFLLAAVQPKIGVALSLGEKMTKQIFAFSGRVVA